MPTFFIDGKEVSFDEGETILQVAWREAISIPVFCYHPHLPVFAGCRMCLVEVETERGRAIVPSCATKAQENIKVFTNTKKIKEVRAGQLEFLLLNHPLECPVCDAGGECDLQDMVFLFGRTQSRFTFEKFKKRRVNAGPFLELYPNRCIVCFRCVSFYRDIAGGDDWGTLNRGEEVFVGPLRPGILENEFSGNMIEICPLGAITGRDYRFQSRPWEHKDFISISPHDSIGVNTRVYARVGGDYSRGPVESGGKRGDWHLILRVNVRVNPDVNGPWIDDRTRFAHGFVNSSDRLKVPLIREQGGLHPSSWDKAIGVAVENLVRIREKYGPDSIGVIAAGRGTNETAFLLSLFAREGLFTANIDSRPPVSYTSFDPVYRVTGSSSSKAKINDIESSDFILLFGVDIKNRFPLLGINLIRAKKRGARIVNIFHYLDRASLRWTTRHLFLTPNNYGVFVKLLLDKYLGKDLSEEDTLDLPGFDQDEISRLIDNFERAKNPLLIFTDDLPYNVQSVLSFFGTLKEEASYLYLRSYPNGQGFVDMGVHPSLRPGQRESAKVGNSALGMLEGVIEGKVRGLVVMNLDPLTEFPLRTLVEDALKQKEFLLLLDSFETETAKYADIVLPIASPYEEEGTYTNTEGRVQFQERVVSPIGASKPAYHILAKMLTYLGIEVPEEPKGIFESMRREVGPYKNIEYGKYSISHESFPKEIPTLEHIRLVYKSPRVKYQYSPKSPKFQTEKRSEAEGFILLRGYRLFKGRYSSRSNLPREIDGGIGVGISPEDAKEIGIKRGDVILLENEDEMVEAVVFINKHLKKGTIEAVWPHTDTELNRLIGPEGYGLVKIRALASKEAS